MNPRLIPSSRLARLTILRTQSDERLRELVTYGSDAAFEAIVHRYRRSLVGHCVRILGSKADAEEAVQEALVSAHAALTKGTEVRSLGPWLQAVAHNAALQSLRRRTARAECPEQECNGHSSVEPAHAMRDELRDLVRAVQELPPRQRDAIVMRELEGRSYEEIAARLGATDGAVRQLLNRARRSMRESLGALIPAEPLIRWLMSADDGSPARGLLTLSGGSAIAVKLSGAAVVSAVSVMTLLPSTYSPARPRPRPEASAASSRRYARATPDRATVANLNWRSTRTRTRPGTTSDRRSPGSSNGVRFSLNAGRQATSRHKPAAPASSGAPRGGQPPTRGSVAPGHGEPGSGSGGGGSPPGGSKTIFEAPMRAPDRQEMTQGAPQTDADTSGGGGGPRSGGTGAGTSAQPLRRFS